MNIKPGTPLKPWQRSHPVLWRSSTDELPHKALEPERWSSMLVVAFGFGRSKRLQTWARSIDDMNGPHWIGVRNGTTLHTDPRYPRYTHHLIVRNDGWRLTGSAMREDGPWAPGTVFCCDTHSPHILLRESGTGLFYLAASIDSATPLSKEETLPRLLEFVRRHL